MRKSFAERLPPDTVAKLERAAGERFASAKVVHEQSRLGALYLYGFSVEMWLCAAYFRSARFSPHRTIDRETRRLRMIQARQIRSESGEFLMSGDPHSLVGWARFLEWQRSASGGLTAADVQRLKEAINRASLVYDYWRPELRYKVVEIAEGQLALVSSAAAWFQSNHRKLPGS